MPFAAFIHIFIFLFILPNLMGLSQAEAPVEHLDWEAAAGLKNELILIFSVY